MTSSSFIRLHNGKVRRLGTAEDAPGIDADLTIAIGNAGSVAHQATDFGIGTTSIRCGECVSRGQVD